MATLKERYRYLWEDELFQKKYTFRKFRTLLGMLMAEFSGVAFYEFLGCSSIIDSKEILLVVLTFAFAIAVAVMLALHISGGVMNPALAVGLMLLGRLSIYRTILYIVFESLGAVLGVAINKMLWSNLPKNFCMTLPGEGVAVWRALFAEVLLTMGLAFLLCSCLDPRTIMHIHLVGFKFAIAIIALVIPGVKYSGCSMNPARSFGPALMALNFQDHWIYWVGPILGTVIMVVIYNIFFMVPLEPPKPPRREEEKATQ